MSTARDNVTESDRIEGVPHPREAPGLLGHARAEAELLEAYRTHRLPHAWLIGGPEGVGKATLAWRFSRFVLAYPDPFDPSVQDATDLSVPRTHPMAGRIAGGAPGDVAVLRREVSEKTGKLSSYIRINDVRRTSGLFQQASRTGGYRICIVDSADDLNEESANALLKLVEEPPPRSLFLFVAHRPKQVMATLRSRCRALRLDSLAEADAVAALASLGAPWASMDPALLAEAARRGEFSVRRALDWLGGDRLSRHRETTTLLDRLPEVDWGGLHRLGDRLGKDPEDFEALVETLLEWIHGRLGNADLGNPAERRRLAPLPEVWEKVRRSARDAQAFNLDKKTFLFSVFAELAQAAGSL